MNFLLYFIGGAPCYEVCSQDGYNNSSCFNTNNSTIINSCIRLCLYSSGIVPYCLGSDSLLMFCEQLATCYESRTLNVCPSGGQQSMDCVTFTVDTINANNDTSGDPDCDETPFNESTSIYTYSFSWYPHHNSTSEMNLRVTCSQRLSLQKMIFNKYPSVCSTNNISVSQEEMTVTFANCTQLIFTDDFNATVTFPVSQPTARLNACHIASQHVFNTSQLPPFLLIHDPTSKFKRIELYPLSFLLYCIYIQVMLPVINVRLLDVLT